MNKTIIWKPPIEVGDIVSLQEMTTKSNCIVSCIPEFRSGRWLDFVDDQIQFGTEYYAHIDANFLARLMEFSKDKPKTKLERLTAATMCLAICANMKVNPTFATHEYAYSGSREPDDRLAYFYFLDNSHPQLLANLALGRIQAIQHKHLDQTAHFGKHKERIQFFGLVHLPLLKLMEIQTNNPTANGSESKIGSAKIKELMQWMFDEFLLVGSVIMLGHELWGRRAIKSLISSPNSTDPEKILRSVENAAWDLVLVLNWAEFENKRNPKNGDPVNLIFTHDKALARIALASMGEPGSDDVDEPYVAQLEEMWPSDIAAELLTFHRNLESNLGSPTRKYAQSGDQNKYCDRLERELIRKIKGNCQRIAK
jgi:hypothetical protein